MYGFNDIHDIRQAFVDELRWESFTTDKTGVKTIELCPVAFLLSHNDPDDFTIFGELNEDYAKREIEWYASMSLNINDIPPPVPEIWRKVADPGGFINSNYGWCVFAPENGLQYSNVLEELKRNPDSRRAVMIYTRPTMWTDYNRNGRSDFMCTNTVQYLIRGGELIVVVQMRSNDAIFGFKNDFLWQRSVAENLAGNLGLDPKKTIYHWNVGSLHVYERHFYLVDHYDQTGKTRVARADYAGAY